MNLKQLKDWVRMKKKKKRRFLCGCEDRLLYFHESGSMFMKKNFKLFT